MDKHDAVEMEMVRPLGRTLARELTQEEIDQVSGACLTTGGNNMDCTTGGGSGVNDRDVLK